MKSHRPGELPTHASNCIAYPQMPLQSRHCKQCLPRDIIGHKLLGPRQASRPPADGIHGSILGRVLYRKYVVFEGAER